MDLFEKALQYASKAHQGRFRKLERIPYILHPAEVAAIAATMTDDPAVLAACLLHDVIEDAGVSAEELGREFGDRVTELVLSETEDSYDELTYEQSWFYRKELSLKRLKDGDRDVKILWLSDKLSNMRSLCRLYRAQGDRLWENFHQKDKILQRWYYHSVADLLHELENTSAYREYLYRMNLVFSEND